MRPALPLASQLLILPLIAAVLVAAAPSPRPAHAKPPARQAAANEPPNAPPRIFAIHISSTTVSAGQRLSGSVTTSSNVASVEVRVAAYGISLNKTGVGRFALSYTVPWVPWFLHGTYTMTVIARNTRGDSTERSLALTVD